MLRENSRSGEVIDRIALFLTKQRSVRGMFSKKKFNAIEQRLRCSFFRHVTTPIRSSCRGCQRWLQLRYAFFFAVEIQMAAKNIRSYPYFSAKRCFSDSVCPIFVVSNF